MQEIADQLKIIYENDEYGTGEEFLREKPKAAEQLAEHLLDKGSLLAHSGGWVVDMDGEPVQFSTPSKNIGCMLSGDQVRCDMAVEVTWEDITEEFSLPKFKPES